MRKLLFPGAGALLMSASSALAQEAQSIDQRVNELFATVTGPFVSFIFAPFPGTGFPWIVMWLVAWRRNSPNVRSA